MHCGRFEMCDAIDALITYMRVLKISALYVLKISALYVHEIWTRAGRIKAT